MRAYFDSSALIKRSIEEPESDALQAAFDAYTAAGDVVITSSLAWVEVSRALLRRLASDGHDDEAIRDAIEVALSGVAEHRATDGVIALARRVGPPVLRSVDAVHLATAIFLDVDTVVAYDDRLLRACRRNGLATTTPGR